MTVLINADTSAGLKMTSDTSGSIAFQSGGTTIMTISSTGVSTQVGSPAFSAYKTSAQSITTNVTTKITFDTEEFDTNNNFASSTFTPTVAGYYQINGMCYLTTGSGTSSNCKTVIYKNGTSLRQGTNINVGMSESQSLASTIVYCNGSTDYIEVYAVIVGTSPSVYGDANGRLYTYFNGAMIRSA